MLRCYFNNKFTMPYAPYKVSSHVKTYKQVNLSLYIWFFFVLIGPINFFFVWK